MTLVKALIEITDRKAVDPLKGLLPVIPVMFNPEKITTTKSVQYAEIGVPGIDEPVQQFVRGKTEVFTMDLFFDTTHHGFDLGAVPVHILTRPFYELAKVQPRTHAPPRIRFIWGVGLMFEGVVEQVRREFTMFSPIGIPVRATLSVTIRQHVEPGGLLAKLNLQSTDHRQALVAKQGEAMSRIAAERYGDPRQWRAIADENPNVDPLEPPPGARLAVPATSDRGGR